MGRRAQYNLDRGYFPNGLLPVRQWGAFYNLRGQRFIATTGYVTVNRNVANVPIAALRNPSGSGKWIFIDQAEFGADADCRFSRYGGGTLTLSGTPIKGDTATANIGKTDGSSGASGSIAELYVGGASGAAFSVSVAGTLRKVAVMRAYQQYQLPKVEGTLILRPGQHSYWLTDEDVGGSNVPYKTLINFEYVEIDATVAADMVTAMQDTEEF